MSWSTRELAELAGTTVNAVRHYHRIGLLDEPERGANGYKHYGSSHLRQLLHIRRLRERGVPIAEIPPDAESHSDERMLRLIEADLSASIDRLQLARAEIRAMLSARGDGAGDAESSAAATR
ncbi:MULTISPECIES: MerR family transcriptional regulator [Microbacterium]|uniref:MerR family transcriptional regulator n=1 Tax=Microbacterium wangchenii TaxID=2541726 RepID=A0ABX5SRF0_9MICO|nr:MULTISPECIES: MerR family transcriptional regulator [Microbacterium]MCK6064916.1 MerR family transcriptional regulator [Microbacterium sp. EYE_512]QBR88397.1 MerR family transcriptional regulator [Microbacterium wangchenii]TXK20124.1 MerR family transcriptional regulator [Microbacterium wangchenii]